MLLIFPSEISFDKNNLPYITLSAVLACVLVFLTFQRSDEAKQHDLIQYYESSGLFQVELAPFQRYLQTPEAKTHYQNIAVTLKEGPERRYFMIFDQNFRQYLLSEPIVDHNAAQQWNVMSQELEDQKQQLVTFHYGLRPDNLTPIPLIAHQFLHGGVVHLIGNMVFLFLFGLGVERLFGPTKTLLIYLTSGILGGLIFTHLNGKPFMPLVGASGAISGLMGAYAVYYGRKRIRFFAWFGVYFNHFKWPAYWVLAFWLIKELYSQLTAFESDVAYLAHLGGLSAGAVIAWLLRSSTNPQSDSSPSVPHTTQLFQKAQQDIRELSFDSARTHLHQLLQHDPDHLNALKSCYHIDKINKKHPRYRQLINQVFAFNPNDRIADDFVLSVAKESLPDHIAISDLELPALFGLCHRYLRNDCVQSAEPLISNAKKHYSQNELLPKLLFQWSNALANRKKFRTAAKELNYLANYYGETTIGQTASKQLKSWKNFADHHLDQ